MAAIAHKLQHRRPGHETPTTLEEERRFWGFVTGTSFKSFARKVGTECGLSAEDLDRIDAGKLTGKRELEKILRRFTFKAAQFKPAISHDLLARWRDRAPTKRTKEPKSIAHLSASTIRYEIDATAALALAVLAFMELSEQIPDRIEKALAGTPNALSKVLDLQIQVTQGHHLVTFERMFLAYRAIFLRDPNYLRGEVAEMLPLTKEGKHAPIFASNAQAAAWRQDFILGKICGIGYRLGESEPLSAVDGTLPGLKTGYGAAPRIKALKIVERNRADGVDAFDPCWVPAILWRMAPPSP